MFTSLNLTETASLWSAAVSFPSKPPKNSKRAGGNKTCWALSATPPNFITGKIMVPNPTGLSKKSTPL
jgi:hypothetical protein